MPFTLKASELATIPDAAHHKNSKKENQGKQKKETFTAAQKKGMRLDLAISVLLMGHFIYTNWDNLTDEKASDHDKAVLAIKVMTTIIPVRTLFVISKGLSMGFLRNIGMSGRLTKYLSDTKFVQAVAENKLYTTLTNPKLEGLITKFNLLIFAPARFASYAIEQDAVETLTDAQLETLEDAYKEAGVALTTKKLSLAAATSTVKPIALLGKANAIWGKVKGFLKSHDIFRPTLDFHAEKMGRVVDDYMKIEYGVETVDVITQTIPTKGFVEVALAEARRIKRQDTSAKPSPDPTFTESVLAATSRNSLLSNSGPSLHSRFYTFSPEQMARTQPFPLVHSTEILLSVSELTADLILDRAIASITRRTPQTETAPEHTH